MQITPTNLLSFVGNALIAIIGGLLCVAVIATMVTVLSDASRHKSRVENVPVRFTGVAHVVENGASGCVVLDDLKGQLYVNDVPGTKCAKVAEYVDSGKWKDYVNRKSTTLGNWAFIIFVTALFVAFAEPAVNLLAAVVVSIFSPLIPFFKVIRLVLLSIPLWFVVFYAYYAAHSFPSYWTHGNLLVKTHEVCVTSDRMYKCPKNSNFVEWSNGDAGLMIGFHEVQFRK